MNPRTFLDVANTLVTGLTEAEWRSAISRAYYAAFHVARQVLRQCGFAVPRADQSHSYLWLRLAHAGHPDVESAGNELNSLRRARNRADYDLDRPLAQVYAIDQVQLAETVIELLDLVSATPAVLTQVTDAMKVYERDVLGEVTWRL
jgi:uncharacterized protein (UPF0332 family)